MFSRSSSDIASFGSSTVSCSREDGLGTMKYIFSLSLSLFFCLSHSLGLCEIRFSSQFFHLLSPRTRPSKQKVICTHKTFESPYKQQSAHESRPEYCRTRDSTVRRLLLTRTCFWSKYIYIYIFIYRYIMTPEKLLFSRCFPTSPPGLVKLCLQI